MERDDFSAVRLLEEGCSHETQNDCDTLFNMSNQLRDLGKMAFCYGTFFIYRQCLCPFVYSNLNARCYL